MTVYMQVAVLNTTEENPHLNENGIAANSVFQSLQFTEH